MQYLSVRKLSDDEFSEADSMTRYIFFTDDTFFYVFPTAILYSHSIEQLDDDQIEQLMLESDGYDTLQDAKMTKSSSGPQRQTASTTK